MKVKVCLGVLMACVVSAHAAEKSITIKGSDTMVILNQRWAESYMSSNSNAIIQVTGGGSGTGFSALISGGTDICAASRPMNAKEKAAIQSKYGAQAVEIPVARDGVAVYLNEANPVKELTLVQIKDIYRGKITNWSQVGGPDWRIILYSRENNSGTYEFFKEHVLLKKDFSPLAQSLPGTAAVVNAITRDKKGIGYGGSAYAKGLKFCAVKADDGAAAFEPSQENIVSGKYPISRNLYFYTRSEPAGAIKSFIDFVKGPEGQKIVSSVGYFPIQSGK